MRKVKIGECLKVKHGWAFKGEYFRERGVQSILTPGNFYEKGGFKPNGGKERYYIGHYPQEYLCHKGDLIIAMTQQAEGLLGSTAIVPENGKYLHNQRIGLITCDESKLFPLFAYYLFMTKSVRIQLERSASGTKVKHTSPEKIYEVLVSLPEVEQQKNIATILYAVEEKENINKRINENLEQQLRTIYDYWFTQFDFPDEKGKPYRSSGGKMVWNEELRREIPEGWECRTLGSLLHRHQQAFDYKSEQPTIDLSIMPSSSIAIAQTNSSSMFATNLYWMDEGDLLFGSIRPYLKKAGIAPCDGVVAGTVHCFQVNDKENYNFALFTLCSKNIFDYAIKVSKGTKMPVVSAEDILSYKVPYSKEISRLFNAFSIQKTICNNVKEIHKLTKLRDWLLPMLMNGQATVAD